MLYAFHTSLPVPASSAASQPRTPNSPPELPTSTFPSATSGAMVMVSPFDVAQLGPPHLLARLGVDGDRVAIEHVEDDLAAPIGRAAVDRRRSRRRPCGGGGVGLVYPFRRRARLGEVEAKTLFGQGATTYIVPFTTSGGASNPSVVPVEKVKATCSLPTFAGVISVEPAEPRRRIILRRHRPVSVVGRRSGGRGDDLAGVRAARILCLGHRATRIAEVDSGSDQKDRENGSDQTDKGTPHWNSRYTGTSVATLQHPRGYKVAANRKFIFHRRELHSEYRPAPITPRPSTVPDTGAAALMSMTKLPNGKRRDA